jgi:hypothetical protein
VDLEGCPVFSLPVSNFRVRTEGENCRTSDDGSISIEAVEALAYQASLSGNGVEQSRSFSDSILFENLPSGSYSVCITVQGEADYQQCYNLDISEPEALSVSSKVNTLGKDVTLDLQGGKQYTILLNGEVFSTRAPQVTLPLTEPVNYLEVRTDKDCQGVYSQRIALTEDPIVLPNPIESGELQVFIPDAEGERVRIRLFTLDGSSILNKELVITDGKVRINMDSFAKGVYLLNASLQGQLYTYKILKR